MTELPTAPDPATVWSKPAPPRELIQSDGLSKLLQYTLTDWCVIASMWLLMAYGPGWTYPFCILIIAGRFHSLGVILHDATHMPLRKKTPGVRVLEVFTGYPIGSSIDAMRYHHLRHHRDSGLATDPYFKAPLAHSRLLRMLMILRTGLLAFWWSLRGLYGTIACYVPSLRQSYAVAFLQDRSGQMVGDSVEVITCLREDRYQLAVQLLMGLLLYRYAGGTLIWALFVPVFIAGMLAGNRLINEHSLAPCKDRSFHTVWTTTNNHNTGFFNQILFAPRNIGYHRVHHLHPQAGLGRLPVLNRWYQGWMECKTCRPGLFPAETARSAQNTPV